MIDFCDYSIQYYFNSKIIKIVYKIIVCYA